MTTRTARTTRTGLPGPGGFRRRTHDLPGAARDLAVIARRLPSIVAIWRDHRVDPQLRESLMYAVAEVNRCRACAYIHHELALATGADPSAVVAGAVDEPATATAIVWARARAEQRLAPAHDTLDAAMRRHWTSAQISDLDTVVRVMDFFNLAGNNLEALRWRLRGRAVPGSLVADAVIGTMYAVGLPAVAIANGRQSGHGVGATLRGLRRFTLADDSASGSTVTSPADRAIGVHA